MNTKAFEILNNVAAFQLLLIIVLLIHKGRKKTSNRFLAIFFIAQWVVYVQGALFFYFPDYFMEMPHLLLIRLPFSFLWGPCIYFYILSDHNFKFQVKKVHLLHLLPVLGTVVLILMASYREDWKFLNPLYGDGRKFLNIIMIVQIIIYNAAASFILKKSTKSWNFGNIDKSRIKWNKFVLYGYIIACLLYNITFITFEASKNINIYVFLSNFIFFIYFNVIIYRALTSPQLFSFTPYIKTESQADEGGAIREHLDKLEKYILEEKPYLDFDLTINDLAKQLSFPPTYLSKLINQRKNQNFYDFINTYRIEEAKNLIIASAESKKTIQEIMYECGYNSKSSFNTAFKKNTGETPTSFRKRFQKVSQI